MKVSPVIQKLFSRSAEYICRDAGASVKKICGYPADTPK
ncbi:hypothetical protein CUS_7583 [Ruminococcus albus 8]|uniref:Uncharacterized protein n=1 Tax=Ruminococcus albus 8 TaxID=246199 RepID=E9SH55_RUMAL|nr:hypothetical protein CUS_7583 [Ruminococcus albus 8]